MTITKLSALALTAVVAVGALAAPALADSTIGFANNQGFNGDYYLTQLRYDGVNAIAADDVTGDTFRATVISPDGHTVFEFFDKDSLVQIKR